MRKNICVTDDTLKDLEALKTLLGLNHSKIIRVALKVLQKELQKELRQSINNILS